MSTLRITDLRVSIAGKQILKGIDLEVSSGEVHAIMGPNGSGKSTLSHALMGHPDYDVTGGSVTLDGEELLGLLAATLGGSSPADGLGFRLHPGTCEGQILVRGRRPPHRAVRAGVGAHLPVEGPLDPSPSGQVMCSHFAFAFSVRGAQV